ncbi:ornithine cyclodeaminase family protein [Paludibacterium purpuratum]|uniref:Ornithine cyclodeaminase n=1 Tax=Paludibacterium purpuratum TaxID=1144873 RepID=A0A4R7B0W7_9NEIS|nr:ornithine cyclodeaminase family protein [Paludibacterium purpuratum]TDR73077.1 ornithine cyclodeaminase [Paludibacterium purpuratum]
MKILNKDQILALYNPAKAAAMIKQGFIAYSEGHVQLPPVQHFLFKEAHGDCCVKSGYLEGDELFVVKVASGFYRNAKQGLANNQGLMMAFSALTGEPAALLLDEGWLTGLRTALAGALAAAALAPQKIDAIGIVGTGMQARLQLEALQTVTPCRTVWVWGHTQDALDQFEHEFAAKGYRIHGTLDAEPLARACQLIVTCTPSTQPILQSEWIQPGTHINAVGADDEGKQELATELVARADLVTVDAVSQCAAYGEVSRAVKAGLLAKELLVELGQIFAGKHPGRQNQSQITITDLTGLAIQDVQIAKSILV